MRYGISFTLLYSFDFLNLMYHYNLKKKVIMSLKGRFLFCYLLFFFSPKISEIGCVSFAVPGKKKKKRKREKIIALEGSRSNRTTKTRSLHFLCFGILKISP